MDAKDHARWVPHGPVAGDVFGTHPQLVASQQSYGPSLASASQSGRGFFRPGNSAVSGPLAPESATSMPPSVIFITCRKR
jgi:hypothetical protein